MQYIVVKKCKKSSFFNGKRHFLRFKPQKKEQLGESLLKLYARAR
jgi:hypothetical protein